jgi:hypothetical protein
VPAGRVASRAALLAGVFVGALAVGYVALILGQGEGMSSRTWFVAIWLGVAAILFLAGAFTAPPRRRALLAGIPACMLLPLAVAALFSIGLFILAPALIGGGAASIAGYEGGVGTWTRVGVTALLVGAATAALILGFSVTT